MLCMMVRTQAMASRVPDAPMACPIIDLVELIANFRAWSPNTDFIALVSVASFNGVDVP